MQQVVDDGEAGILDDTRGVNHLLRQSTGLKHFGDGVEGGIGHRMQLAVKLRRFVADRETAQHLAGMLPESRADLGEDNIAARDFAVGDELCRHA